MRRSILTWTGVAVVSAACLVIGLSEHAQSSTVMTITATETGTSAQQPVNGTLYLYDNATALHHTRSVTYYQHDGYSKTENLVSSTRPLGVVLKREDIENACDANPNDGSVNPVGGYENIPCGGFLVTTPPPPFPLGGDLTGRFCRVAQPPDPTPADCTSDPIHVNETATGSGPYLTVGNKDHGAMTEIDYYTNVAGTDVEVDVVIPFPVEVTRVVLLPGGPSAVVVLNA